MMPFIKLLAFDFDESLVNFHGHHLANQAGYPPITSKPGPIVLEENSDTMYKQGAEKINVKAVPTSEMIHGWLTNPTEGTKYPSEVVQLFLEFMEKGHYISIVSYSQYPQIITETLKHIFEEHAPANKKSAWKNICVVAGHPTEQRNGKEEHINAAIEVIQARKGVTIERSNCILVDDDEANLTAARAKDHLLTVLVPAGNSERKPKHIDKIRVMLYHGYPRNEKECIDTATQLLEDLQYKQFLQARGYIPSDDDSFDSAYDEFINNLVSRAYHGYVGYLVDLRFNDDGCTVEQIHETLESLINELFEIDNDEDPDDNDIEDGNDCVEDEDNESVASPATKEPLTFSVSGSPAQHGPKRLSSSSELRVDDNNSEPKRFKQSSS